MIIKKRTRLVGAGGIPVDVFVFEFYLFTVFFWGVFLANRCHKRVSDLRQESKQGY